jgi:flagellar basal body-associated protein FliL
MEEKKKAKMQLLLLIVIVVLICVIAGIVYRNTITQEQINELTERDTQLAEAACVQSVNASKNESPILALISTVEAHTTIRNISQRYGNSRTASKLLGVDMADCEKKFKIQRNRIIKDILRSYPEVFTREEFDLFTAKDV